MYPYTNKSYKVVERYLEKDEIKERTVKVLYDQSIAEEFMGDCLILKPKSIFRIIPEFDIEYV